LGESISVISQKVVRLKNLPAFRMTLTKNLSVDNSKAHLTRVELSEDYLRSTGRSHSKIQYPHVKNEGTEKRIHKASKSEPKLMISYSKSIRNLGNTLNNLRSKPVILQNPYLQKLVSKNQNINNLSPFYQREKIHERNLPKSKSPQTENSKVFAKLDKEFQDSLTQVRREFQASASKKFFQALMNDTKKKTNVKLTKYEFPESLQTPDTMQSYYDKGIDRPKSYTKYTRNYELGTPKYKRSPVFAQAVAHPDHKKEGAQQITHENDLSHPSLRFPTEERERLEELKKFTLDVQEIRTARRDSETLDSGRFTPNPYRLSIEDITKVPAKALQEPIGKFDHPILGRSDAVFYIRRWNRQSLANFTEEKRRSKSAVRIKSSKRFVSPFIRYKEGMDKDNTNYILYSTAATDRMNRDDAHLITDTFSITKVGLESRPSHLRKSSDVCSSQFKTMDGFNTAR
jgi:hypothetical protein